MTKSRYTILGLCIAAVGILITLWSVFIQPTHGSEAAQMVLQHFPALIGLPMAAIAAFVLVSWLSQRSGEGVHFRALGMELSGPTGEVVLWVVCFLSMAGAIKLLW